MKRILFNIKSTKYIYRTQIHIKTVRKLWYIFFVEESLVQEKQWIVKANRTNTKIPLKKTSEYFINTIY